MSRPRVHFIGARFGRLVLEQRLGDRKWFLRCDCGGTCVANASNVSCGRTTSCGCAQKDAARANGITQRIHGLAGSRTWRTWESMRRRCSDPRLKNYPRYGGRGITVCERWKNDFVAFLADMGVKPPGLTLERIDNSKGYSPDNCRWATYTEQNNNRRGVHRYAIDGRALTVTEWARETGVPATRIHDRLRRGMTIVDAINAPVDAEQQRRSFGQRAQRVNAAVGGAR